MFPKYILDKMKAIHTPNSYNPVKLLGTGDAATSASYLNLARGRKLKSSKK